MCAMLCWVSVIGACQFPDGKRGVEYDTAADACHRPSCRRPGRGDGP